MWSVGRKQWRRQTKSNETCSGKERERENKEKKTQFLLKSYCFWPPANNLIYLVDLSACMCVYKNKFVCETQSEITFQQI